jgi:MFS family permease
MLMITGFMACQALLIVFAPLYVAELGVQPGALIPYYTVNGLLLTISQLVVGRASDRFGRGSAIRAGCGLAILGLTAAMLGGSFATLLAASGAFSLATALVAPSLSALAMDTAPAARVGAAMATFSVGYQLATGIGGILWGLVIAVAGFRWAFCVAVGLQVTTFVGSLRYARAPSMAKSAETGA